MRNCHYLKQNRVSYWTKFLGALYSVSFLNFIKSGEVNTRKKLVLWQFEELNAFRN